MVVAINGTVSSFEDSSTTTSAVLSVPAGVVAGELLIAGVAQGAQSAVAVPSGWTTLAQQNGADPSSPSEMMCYRVATSSEPTSYTFTVTLGRITAYLFRVGGQDASVPIDVTPASSTSATATSYTNPTVTTTTDGVLLIYGIVLNAATAADIVTATGTTQVIGSTGTGKRYSIYTETQATAGASTARTWTDTPSSGLQWDGVVVPIRASTVAPGPAAQPSLPNSTARRRASNW